MHHGGVRRISSPSSETIRKTIIVSDREAPGVLSFCTVSTGPGGSNLTGPEGRDGIKKITVTRNRSVFLRPDRFHEYGASKSEPWSYYYIHYEGSLAAEYTRLILEGVESGTCLINESEEYLRDFCLILVYRLGGVIL